MSEYFVYILANKRNGTLYTGFTSDLLNRVSQHKNNLVDGFTKKYSVHKLVYFEQCDDYDAALQREKDIKEWKRKWKVELIEKVNPLWQDLYDETLSNC
jgi:putative endonuclease